MYLTRRAALQLLPAAAAASPASASVWTPEWGRAVVGAAVSAQDPNFDTGASMLVRQLGSAYSYHSALRWKARECIRHAACSVKRRNVTMTYTNLAVKGAFVALAAGQLLGDRELWDYAADRQRRFAKTVDETGSFAEYNSPTYANVTIANLTRIRIFVKDAGVRALNEKIHERIWRHLGRLRLRRPSSSPIRMAGRWFPKALSRRWKVRVRPGRSITAARPPARRARACGSAISNDRGCVESGPAGACTVGGERPRLPGLHARGPVEPQQAAFSESRAAQPAPAVRLSEERLI